MATITVTPECNAQIKQYAQEKGLDADAAACKMIDGYVGRLSAVRKYAKKNAPPKAKKPAAKAKAPKAKKAAAKEA